MPYHRALIALAALPWMACSRTPPPAAPAPAPVVAPAAMVEELAARDLKATAQDLETLLTGCYQLALIERPDTQVELTYALELARNGSVSNTSIEHKGTCSTLFLVCIQDALQSLRFAPNPEGPLAVVRGQLSFVQRPD